MAASCQTQEMLLPEPQDIDPGINGGMKEMIITAETEGNSQDTRTSLVIEEDNSTKVLWTPGDEIKIFSAGESAKFTAINEVPSRKAKFRGEVSMIFGEDESGGEKDYVWGLYPYRDDATYSEPDGEGVSRTAVITTTIPSVQEGKPGTFADNVATMIGRSEASLLISYKNAYSGVIVRFNREDIVSVTVRGIHYERLAGRVVLGLDSNQLPCVKDYVSGEREVTITDSENGTFVPGENYFLITLPDVNLEEGYSLTVKRSDGKEATFNSLPTVNKFIRNKFRSFKNPLDTYIEDEDNINSGRSTGWHSSQPQDNEIWYRAIGGEVYGYATDENTGNEVLENIAPNDNFGVGIIRFSAPVITVDDGAFFRNGSSSLTSVILPSCVETIGTKAFGNCSALKDITIGENLKAIMPKAFSSCGIESINLPEGLEEICYDAFWGCDNLTSVRIPQSVINLGGIHGVSASEPVGNPFAYCASLASFSGKYATRDGRALVADFNGHDYLVSFASSGLESYSAPSVYGIGNLAFYNTSLKQVVLPESLTAIGDYAFSFSLNLESITIPAGVRYIGSASFLGDKGLQWILMDCTSVPEVTLSNYPDSFIKGRIFDQSTCAIYVPTSLLEDYQNADYWKNYASRYVAL